MISLRTMRGLKKSKDITETIASKDRNNLYITSTFFKDQNKYKAFCTFYAVMRIVDDRIDNLPPYNNRSKELNDREMRVLDAWEHAVILCHQGILPPAAQLEACRYPEAEAVCRFLIRAFRAFPLPIKLWTNFFQAMRSDMLGKEFTRWTDFLAYAEGATVSPTSIYLWLLAAQLNNQTGKYEIPEGAELFRCGRFLGLFAYLGHIIRDLADDVRNGNTRICLTREDMSFHGVGLENLKNDANNRKATPPTRSLTADMLHRAREYFKIGRVHALKLMESFESDSRFILELIISIYENIILKIELTGYDPMTDRHYLTKKDKADIVNAVAMRTGFQFPK